MWLFPALGSRLRNQSLRPNDIIIDNLSSHKVKGVADAIASAKAQALATLQSGLQSPFELAFSKLKRLLGTAKNHSLDRLWNKSGSILDQFNESEFRNYFRHPGYRYP